MKAPIDLKKMTKENKAFLRVMDTGKFGQLVLISLCKGEDLGDELHPTTDELYYVVEGKGEIKLEGKSYPFEEHDTMLIPAGMRHNVINIGKEDLKLFALFTTPIHPVNEIFETREKALALGKH